MDAFAARPVGGAAAAAAGPAVGEAPGQVVPGHWPGGVICSVVDAVRNGELECIALVTLNVTESGALQGTVSVVVKRDSLPPALIALFGHAGSAGGVSSPEDTVSSVLARELP